MELFKSLLMTGLSAVRFGECMLFLIQIIKGSRVETDQMVYVFELQKREIYVAGLQGYTIRSQEATKSEMKGQTE